LLKLQCVFAFVLVSCSNFTKISLSSLVSKIKSKILLSFSIFLHSSQQIVLVVSDNFNTHKAKLQCFEDSKKLFDTIDVNIGRNGLGFGLGEVKLTKNENQAIKIEGDGKAPIGVFKLSSIFGYPKNNNSHMPYIHTSKNLICVDESNSKYYNKIIHMPIKKPNSFEFMKRRFWNCWLYLYETK